MVTRQTHNLEFLVQIQATLFGLGWANGGPPDCKSGLSQGIPVGSIPTPPTVRGRGGTWYTHWFQTPGFEGSTPSAPTHKPEWRIGALRPRKTKGAGSIPASGSGGWRNW